MNAPVLIYSAESATIRGFAELEGVRLIHPVVTDDGTSIPKITEGSVGGP